MRTSTQGLTAGLMLAGLLVTGTLLGHSQSCLPGDSDTIEYKVENGVMYTRPSPSGTITQYGPGSGTTVELCSYAAPKDFPDAYSDLLAIYQNDGGDGGWVEDHLIKIKKDGGTDPNTGVKRPCVGGFGCFKF